MGFSSSPPVRVLGRYALYDEIASGGMASVHIGRLLGSVGFSRTVAIKRLHGHFAKEPDFVSMFLDEARLAARIHHPNVVGTLDVVAREGELFLVMEYVHGESLARLMRALRDRGEAMPVPIAASIMLGVLEGLHAAHEATSDRGEPLGIVHRDVSPHNILVGTDGVARLLDFGVAKASGRVQTTRNGQLKGKLGYMAPEQITGNATRVTDVHAASVVLWEMLTGRRLYQGENELQTYSNVLAGSAVPPSTYVPKVSPELDRLVLKGLHSDPNQRFPSAREMARALQRTARIAPPSDVGDWVEEVGGPTISSRARTVAAVESSGMLPVDSLPRDVLDPVSPLSSHPPVSVERMRAPRGRLVIVPAMLTTLATGALIGIFVRTSRPPPSIASSNAPSIPSAMSVASASPPAAAFTSTPGVASTSPSSAPARASMAPAKWTAAIEGQRPIRWFPAAPAKPAPSSGGVDFTHVMDSRK